MLLRLCLLPPSHSVGLPYSLRSPGFLACMAYRLWGCQQFPEASSSFHRPVSLYCLQDFIGFPGQWTSLTQGLKLFVYLSYEGKNIFPSQPGPWSSMCYLWQPVFFLALHHCWFFSSFPSWSHGPELSQKGILAPISTFLQQKQFSPREYVLHVKK